MKGGTLPPHRMAGNPMRDSMWGVFPLHFLENSVFDSTGNAAFLELLKRKDNYEGHDIPRVCLIDYQ